ncbi:MAG: hypothetical protein FWG98_13735 [Candidatus Cloacimonetes bacterium]|nr:hypothetical protein [Candidatus Cloacimonadota bacterium]
MKFNIFLFTILVSFTIILLSCSSKKTTESEGDMDWFFVDVESTEYVVSLLGSTWDGGYQASVNIVFNASSSSQPNVILMINNDTVVINWYFDNWDDCWYGYSWEVIYAIPGHNLSIQLITPGKNTTQTLTIPHRPHITNTNSPTPNTNFTLNWTLSQNADLQIVEVDTNELGYYLKAIPKDHRQHIIPGSAFIPGFYDSAFISIWNVTWRKNDNHGFMIMNVGGYEHLNFSDSQDMLVRLRNKIFLLKK